MLKQIIEPSTYDKVLNCHIWQFNSVFNVLFFFNITKFQQHQKVVQQFRQFSYWFDLRTKRQCVYIMLCFFTVILLSPALVFFFSLHTADITLIPPPLEHFFPIKKGGVNQCDIAFLKYFPYKPIFDLSPKSAKKGGELV